MVGECNLPSQSDDKKRRQLVQELVPLLKGSHHDDRRPPFTIDQLTIMALIVLPPESTATQKRLVAWIENHFPYYRTHGFPCLTAEGVVTEILSLRTPASRVATIEWKQPPCLTSLTQWQVPIEKHGSELRTYKVTSMSEARLFLQPILSPPKTPINRDHDHFSRLPAELRNRIYGMVLAYPQSGVLIRSDRLYVLSHDVDDAWTPRRWIDADLVELEAHRGKILRCPPLETHLAVLAVNRQIRREALPIFYGATTFVFADLPQIARFATPQRGPWLKSIALVTTIQNLEKSGRCAGGYFSRDSFRHLDGGCGFQLVLNGCTSGAARDIRTREIIFAAVRRLRLHRFEFRIHCGSKLVEKAIEESVRQMKVPGLVGRLLAWSIADSIHV